MLARAIPVLAVLAGCLSAQVRSGCACGVTPPSPPRERVMEPYALAPDDLRPYFKFTKPHYEHYTKTVEYNGAAREVPDPDLKTLSEIRVGFLGPLENHPDEKLGRMMLAGAELAIEEANARGGYCGKPFKLYVHSDQLLWGSSSNEIVKMTYDEQVWGILGSISGDSTHIGLRVALKSELPMVNSAATDPTIPETIIPWYFTTIQDDRVQCYTLARRIYTDLGLKRAAILRVNDRYGRFGVGKFKDASRRLGRPVVIEQKYMIGDTDFSRQLQVIKDSRVDSIVIWGDAKYAGGILKQMRAMGMQQRVFGSFRVLGEELFETAGANAEGLEFVFPYDPDQDRPLWKAFQQRFAKRFQKQPEAFASLAYDAMSVLLESICRAGLNRGRIRDAFTSIETVHGVTGDMAMDPNNKNVSAMFLGTVKAGGKVEYRRYPMQLPHAEVSRTTPEYTGPALPDAPQREPLQIALFGPDADRVARDATVAGALGGRYRLVPVVTDAQWGKSTNALVQVLMDQRTLGVISTDRDGSHLAEQLGNKLFVPVLALSSDRSLTSMGVPWIIRMPAETPAAEAVKRMVAAAEKAGPNRAKVRDVLAAR